VKARGPSLFLGVHRMAETSSVSMRCGVEEQVADLVPLLDPAPRFPKATTVPRCRIAKVFGKHYRRRPVRQVVIYLGAAGLRMKDAPDLGGIQIAEASSSRICQPLPWPRRPEPAVTPPLTRNTAVRNVVSIESTLKVRLTHSFSKSAGWILKRPRAPCPPWGF
jgi:hypothetical protein